MATLAELQQDLTDLRALRTAILTGAQEYSGMAGKISVKRADLSVVNAEIERVELKIQMLSNGGRLTHSTAVFSGER